MCVKLSENKILHGYIIFSHARSQVKKSYDRNISHDAIFYDKTKLCLKKTHQDHTSLTPEKKKNSQENKNKGKLISLRWERGHITTGSFWSKSGIRRY